LGTHTAFAKCENVQIAEWNWASGELMANVDSIILKTGFGCNVEKIPAATNTTFASMGEKGQPDIAGELWVNTIRTPLEKAIKAGTLHAINDGPITGLGEGWWLSPKTAKAHPELKTVLDVLKHPEFFPDKEDPSKGAFIGCPAGWGCQLANVNLFRAFEMEKKGWKLVDPGSAAGLDGSMTKAVERGKNWFGYYWSPTAMIGKHKMVKLDFGVPYAGDDNWNNCIAKAEQDCTSPKPSAWTTSEVNTVITDKFKKSADADVLEYLKKRVFPSDVMNQMLVYMADEQADGETAAMAFLTKHEALWETWVSKETAKKIKASIKK
jgi:glycine betaine/proline transport system substrate-binding protein